jgi:hypothetical protein
MMRRMRGRHGIMDKREIIEELAALEHKQWMQWSRSVADEVDADRVDRWRPYWVPYDELPDEVKELDREWAR